MGKASYYIGILLLILSVSFVIYQYKKDNNNESAIAKITNADRTNDKQKSNLLSNRDIDLIKIDGFEHENMSKLGQLREQFTISLHMAYIGIHSLSNQTEAKIRSAEDIDETYRRVIIELQNARKTLDMNTVMSEKLESLITTARESNVQNQETIDYLYDEINNIDVLYNHSIENLDKAESSENTNNEDVFNKAWIDSMINRIGSPNPYRYATQDDFDYYTAKYIRDYLKVNMKQDKEIVIVKMEKARNIAEQLMDAAPEDKKELSNSLKEALKQLK